MHRNTDDNIYFDVMYCISVCLRNLHRDLHVWVSQRGPVNKMILICGVCLLSEVRVKIGRGHVEDRRSRHCPYLDTINRLINMTNVI